MSADQRRALLEIFNAALAAVNGERVVRDWLGHHPIPGDVHLLAVGKAACAMARGAQNALQLRIANALIITKHGYAEPLPWPVHASGHPLPDAASLEAGARLKSFIGTLPADATVLVLLMILPGLALFYSGLVRTKNALSVLMQVGTVTVIGMILWALVGYSLAFTTGPTSTLDQFIGALRSVAQLLPRVRDIRRYGSAALDLCYVAAGRFDAYIGAYLDEPSPRGLAEQWTRQGWGALNYGRWASAAFDSLFAAARAVPEPARARAASSRSWPHSPSTPAGAPPSHRRRQSCCRRDAPLSTADRDTCAESADGTLCHRLKSRHRPPHRSWP